MLLYCDCGTAWQRTAVKIIRDSKTGQIYMLDPSGCVIASIYIPPDDVHVASGTYNDEKKAIDLLMERNGLKESIESGSKISRRSAKYKISDKRRGIVSLPLNKAQVLVLEPSSINTPCPRQRGIKKGRRDYREFE